jgi:putative ABC transport system permease protein
MVALVGGLVMAVAAGARRSDASYPALVAWSVPPDDLLTLAPSPTFARVSAAEVRSLPQVAAVGEFDGFGVLFPASVNLVAPVDGVIPGGLWHRKLLAGTLPDPGRPDEADISFTVAQAEHLAVGGTLRVTLLAAGNKPVPFAFRVAGIEAAPGEFPPQYGIGYDFVWATPAFARQFAARLPTVSALAARLRGGAAAVPALERELSRRGGGKPVSDFPLATQAANTQHTIRLQAVVLWLLAGALALLGLIVLSQLLSRLTALESSGLAGLRAVGMSPAQLAAAGLLRVVAISTCGAVLALPLAFAVSPVFPVGLAATAEPRPGFDADWVVFALGAVSVVVAVSGCAAWPAWRSARAAVLPPADLPRPHAGVSALVRWFRPVSAAVGVRLALYRGAGRSAVPVASTVIASVVGVLGLSAALVFSASLGSLLATPRHYGTAWDAFVSDVSYPGSLAPAVTSVAADSAVARWTGSYGPIALDIDGAQVGAMTTGPGPDGILAATPLRGAQPESITDIVLGQRTLAALHARIGDTVTVAIAGLPRRVAMRIVGTAVFPAFGDTTQLGTGAEITVAGLDGLKPPNVQLPPFGWLLVTFKAGTSPAAGLSALSARLAKLGPFAVAAPSTPADLVNFGQLEDLPLLIGLSLGVLALLTVAHLLFTSVRRRRRDLAVLRALGFTSGQVRATVSWMAVTVAAVALVIGIPLGVVSGRLAWQFLAAQLGIQPGPVLSPASLVILAAAGIALAVAVAVVPGAAAARARTATVLRTE